MDNRTIREEIARAVFIELWNACPNGIGPIMAYEHHEDIWLKCADAVLPLITAAREEGRREGIEAAAEVAENRWEAWKEPGHGVSCDVTACENIAQAIRSLPPSQ